MSTLTLAEPPVLEKLAPIDPDGPPLGTVYTDTVIFSPPETYAADAPYQIAIIDLDDGIRLTARIHGDNVVIGDRVQLLDYRKGIPYYQKTL